MSGQAAITVVVTALSSGGLAWMGSLGVAWLRDRKDIRDEPREAMANAVQASDLSVLTMTRTVKQLDSQMTTLTNQLTAAQVQVTALTADLDRITTMARAYQEELERHGITLPEIAHQEGT